MKELNLFEANSGPTRAGPTSRDRYKVNAAGAPNDARGALAVSSNGRLIAKQEWGIHLTTSRLFLPRRDLSDAA